MSSPSPPPIVNAVLSSTPPASSDSDDGLPTPVAVSLEELLSFNRSFLILLVTLNQTVERYAALIYNTSNDSEVDAPTLQQVIVALATLQSSVQDLSRAYINHANTVLGPGAGGALDSNLTNILTSSGLLSGGRPTAPDLVLPAEESAADGKKKRKRAKHDPNAPKRALTPYFLFMQTARAQIAKELGDSAKPKEVADEGTRRWSTMAPEDKHVRTSRSLLRTSLLTCDAGLGGSLSEESGCVSHSHGSLQGRSDRS